MKDKLTIWVWHCNAPQGGFLYKGNPNRGLPNYHLGGITNLICGEHLVWDYTRKALEMDVDILWWNERFPAYKVKPKQIMVEIRPYYYRKKEEQN